MTTRFEIRPRLGPPTRIFLLLVLCSSLSSQSRSADYVRGFEALLHYRLPGGGEETTRVSDLHFVYYERRFSQKSTGFGKPGKMAIHDRPHAIQAVQNEDFKKLKFKKLVKIQLEYRQEEGKRLLYLVATRQGKKGNEEVAWPAHSLRNFSVAELPHFRAKLDGKLVDILLPPLVQTDAPEGSLLVRIDFQFPGQKKRRDWF
ncbi:MAG: hypothetical protein DMH00_05040 [Acidobacteria bacterium]|nr:MAG: hypothetical protein DMH00_05040 [Acidobacteriota bacterium]